MMFIYRQKVSGSTIGWLPHVPRWEKTKKPKLWGQKGVFGDFPQQPVDIHVDPVDIHVDPVDMHVDSVDIHVDPVDMRQWAGRLG